MDETSNRSANLTNFRNLPMEKELSSFKSNHNFTFILRDRYATR